MIFLVTDHEDSGRNKILIFMCPFPFWPFSPPPQVPFGLLRGLSEALDGDEAGVGSVCMRDLGARTLEDPPVLSRFCPVALCLSCPPLQPAPEGPVGAVLAK